MAGSWRPKAEVGNCWKYATGCMNKPFLIAQREAKRMLRRDTPWARGVAQRCIAPFVMGIAVGRDTLRFSRPTHALQLLVRGKNAESMSQSTSAVIRRGNCHS